MSRELEILVFLGPSLPLERARAELEAIYRPPAARGDILRATSRRPWAIGLIDGYFESRLAVWHKEILWAMDQGVHVFGAASMGALRAAELAAFGMEGIGRIFEAFASGELERDDEVALIHASEAHGYLPGSESLVNLRATFAAAQEAGLIGRATHDALLLVAQELYYPLRDYPAVVEGASNRGADAGELRAFGAWLPEGRVDQKAADAVALLRELGRRSEVQDRGSEGPPESKSVAFTFQPTEAWIELRRKVQNEDLHEQEDDTRSDGEAGSDRLAPLRSHALERADVVLREKAWNRLLVREITWVDSEVDNQLVAARIAAFCRRRGLENPETLERELNRQGLSYVRFLRLMKEEARAERLRLVYASGWPAALDDQARLEGLGRKLADSGPADQDPSDA